MSRPPAVSLGGAGCLAGGSSWGLILSRRVPRVPGLSRRGLILGAHLVSSVVAHVVLSVAHVVEIMFTLSRRLLILVAHLVSLVVAHVVSSLWLMLSRSCCSAGCSCYPGYGWLGDVQKIGACGGLVGCSDGCPDDLDGCRWSILVAHLVSAVVARVVPPVAHVVSGMLFCRLLMFSRLWVP